jgi:chromosome partitioning protein
LLIDLDPQGNASTALGVDHQRGVAGTYEVLTGAADIADVVVQSPEHENLFCLPATIDLASAELDLFDAKAREYKLKDALRKYLKAAANPPHFVFIDSPPSLSLLTMNGLCAATEVLVPIQCEYYALEGLALLLSHIEKVREKMNRELHLSTILMTMFDGRTRLSSEVAEEVRNFFPKETLKTIIPRSVRLSEAPSFRQSGVGFDPKNPGSLSYFEAAIEMVRRGAPQPN